MSKATTVPETYGLSGDDTKEILKRAGRGKLVRESFRRFGAADGSSFSRALGHAGLLTFFPALIAVVGAAVALHFQAFTRVLDRTVSGLAPGPSGRILTEALQQGSKGSGRIALIFGGAAALISGATAMAQIQRGANRIYGLERDRPVVKRYLVAFVLNLTAGLILLVAFALMVTGAAITDAGRAVGWSSAVTTALAYARWPVGVLLAVLAITLVMKVAPNRRQPRLSWMVSGTVIATVLWLVFTAALGIYFALDKHLGETYGPLLGIVGLLLWSYLTSIALFLGFAFAAQLESVRASQSSVGRDVVRVPEAGAEPIETARLA
jgi:YihY family inner membrane protein